MEERNTSTWAYDSEVELVKNTALSRGVLAILEGYDIDDEETTNQVVHHIESGTVPRLFGHTPSPVPVVNHSKVYHVVGEGAHGTVKMVKVGNQYVAMKECNHVDVAREVAILSVTFHENIIELVGYNTNRLYLNLCSRSLRSGLENISIDDAVFQVVCGVKYLHSLNILHGDLKPDNILVQEGTLKITDYGVSEMGIPRAVYCRKYTNWYRPPELGAMLSSAKARVEGDLIREVLDHTPDIYALGLVVYFIVTRKDLFYRMDEKEMLGAQSKLDTDGFVMREKDKKWEKYFNGASWISLTVTIENIPHRDKIMAMLRNSPSARVY